MFKNIIPHLVSIETELDKINGFYLCDDFNMYESIKIKMIFIIRWLSVITLSFLPIMILEMVTILKRAILGITAERLALLLLNSHII